MPNPPFAHSFNNEGEPHSLETHLQDVAALAGQFAEVFDSRLFAIATGLWHDLGKNAADFQEMLAKAMDGHDEDRGRVDHSSAGAIYAVQQFGRDYGLPIAFSIAGHHAGLPDKVDLDQRLKDKVKRLADACKPLNKVVLPAEKPQFPASLQSGLALPEERKRRHEFWIRMLFSCLVDADFLDTEDHFEGGQADKEKKSSQRGNFASIPILNAKLDAKLAKFGPPVGLVNTVRARVLADCRTVAEQPQGVFTLTAPTGCGKTLAGMAFALEHAIRHNLQRVIVVLPFTSIIDQNAQVYRDIFGSENVIDHHASLDPKKETTRNRIACENWDAPIIITTNVQFLESLLSNKPSKCRKLHNIVNSVVIFDEVQTLPIPYLLPIVDVLKELVRAYKVSLVLSTATQPALRYRKFGLNKVFPGFEHTTEIVQDVERTFSDLRRVNVEFDQNVTEWQTLADDIMKEDEILVITHLRDDAQVVAKLVDGCVHLSALMTPKHRRKVIQDIREQLESNRKCREQNQPSRPLRVISTQLVEAGVDLDFPVVFRAMAGFDSIAQAAGRCNRNGRLECGRVRIFRPPTKPPAGTLRTAQGVANTMLAAEPDMNPIDPSVFDPYFRLLYSGQKLDSRGILSARQSLQFKTVSDSFNIIENDWSEHVIVPHDEEAKALVKELKQLLNWKVEGKQEKVKRGKMRDVFRMLQQYAVSAPCRLVESKNAADAFDHELYGTIYIIDEKFVKSLYHDQYGLQFVPPFNLTYDPNELSV